MRRIVVIISLLAMLIFPLRGYTIETAPRITDKEIVERLTRLEEGQKALNKRIDGLEKSLNKRIDDLRAEMNDRFNTLQWMLGLFIAIALVILGFVLRMQWQMQRRQTNLEATLSAHKEEINFLKNLIEKLIPPKGAL